MATTKENQVSLHALPEAMLQLGDFLARTQDSLPFPYWSVTSADLIRQFIAMTRKYKEAIHFDYSEWRKNFESGLAVIQARVGTEADTGLFDAIRSAIAFIEHGDVSLAVAEVYFNDFGLPADFKTWVYRILYAAPIRRKDLINAHQPDFDPDRLREIFRDWETLGDWIDDDVPF